MLSTETGRAARSVGEVGRRRRLVAMSVAVCALALTGAPHAPAAVPPAEAGAPLCLPVPLFAERCPIWERSDDDGGQGAIVTDLAVRASDGLAFVANVVNFDTVDTASNLVAVRSDGSTAWTTIVDHPNQEDRVTAMAVGPEGEGLYLTVGATLVALDADTGTQRWEAQTAGAGAALTADHDGDRVLVGGQMPGVPPVGFIEAFEAGTGDSAWRFETAPSEGTFYGFASIASGPSGRIVAEGFAGGGADQALIVGLAESGPPGQAGDVTQLWSRVEPASGWRHMQILLSSDGSTAFVSTGVRVEAIDAGDGTRRWSEVVDPVSTSSTRPVPMALAPDGNRLFVTGIGSDPSDAKTTIALDTATGERAWTATSFGPPDAVIPAAVSVAAGPSGDVYVTGNQRNPSNHFVFWLLVESYDAETGAVRWVTRFNESQAQLADARGELIELGSGGTILVAGQARDQLEVQFGQTSILLSFPG